MSVAEYIFGFFLVYSTSTGKKKVDCTLNQVVILKLVKRNTVNNNRVNSVFHLFNIGHFWFSLL